MQDSGGRHSQCRNERVGLMRLCGVIALFIALLISNSAVWAISETQSKASVTVPDAPKIVTPAVSFTSNTRIMLFSPSAGQWVISTFAQTKPGNEFYFNNKLYRVVDSDKAQVVPNIGADKLLEADLQYDETSRRPKTGDAVQVLDKDIRFVAHALFDTVQPGAIIRFHGRAYKIKADRSLVNTGIVFSSAKITLRRIEITRSAWQHIIDRHTVSGTKNTGTSIFNQGENIQALINDAQLAAPVIESNGYFSREFDAGRNIGFDGAKNKQTSTYRVITTQSGKLVTAYPVLN